MQQTELLDQAIKKILEDTSSKSDASPTFTPQFMQEALAKFSQLKEGTEFNAMSIGSIKSAFSSDTLALAVGVGLASVVAGFLGKFIPVGNFTTIIAGLILTMVFKAGFMHNFAKGVLIAGIASFISGIGGSLGGLVGGSSSSTSNPLSSVLSGVNF